MIPVHDSLITLVDISTFDQAYQDLLNAELAYIRPKSIEITWNAKRVYHLTTTYKSDLANEVLVSRCYDFKLLENLLTQYLNR